MVSSLALTASPSTETWLEHKESQVALLNLKVLRLCERGNQGTVKYVIYVLFGSLWLVNVHLPQVRI